MFRLPRPTPAPTTGRRAPSPLRRAALFGGGLVCLWGALQLAPLPAGAPPAAPPSALPTTAAAPAPGAAPSGAEAPARAAAARPPAPRAADGRAGGAGVRRRSERGLLRPGNVVALLLLAGGGAFAVVLHRKKRGATVAAGPAPAMGVLGELPLGPGQAVRLVRVHDEVLVLGVAPSGLTLLHRYPYEAPAAAPAAAPAPTAALFADVLRQYAPAAAHA